MEMTLAAHELNKKVEALTAQVSELTALTERQSKLL
jgi:hypothetical protein